MSLPSTSLAARLCLAATAALAVIAAGAVWLTPPPVSAASGLAPTEASAAVGSRLPRGLRPVAQAWLFGPGQEVPAAIAPVVEILPSGIVVLRRGAAVATRPDDGAGLAAVVLPAARLTGLTPRQRTALLDLLGALLSPRPVPVGAVRLHGIGASEAVVARLLGWVR